MLEISELKHMVAAAGISGNFTPPTFGEQITQPITDLFEQYARPGKEVSGRSKEEAYDSLGSIANGMGLDGDRWAEYPLFSQLREIIDREALRGIKGQNLLLTALDAVATVGHGGTVSEGPLPPGHRIELIRYTYFIKTPTQHPYPGGGELPEAADTAHTRAIDTYQISIYPSLRLDGTRGFILQAKQVQIDDTTIFTNLVDESHRLYAHGQYLSLPEWRRALVPSRALEDRDKLHDYSQVVWRREETPQVSPSSGTKWRFPLSRLWRNR